MSKKHLYLEWMQLYRFQSHTNTTIKFDPESNAIVGATDSGKTAISRALYWALYNRPTRANDAFITYGSTECFVKVHFKGNPDVEITRGRKNEENYYLLEIGTQKYEFRGFGFEVPPEILAAHGMPLIDFDDSGSDISLNISQQLDPIFMFADSASRRAKVLGKLSGADRIDGALGVTAGWLKDKTAEVKVIGKNLKDTDERIKSFKDLSFLGTLIAKIDTYKTGILANEDLLLKVGQECAVLDKLLLDKKFLEKQISKTALLEGLSSSIEDLVNCKQQFDVIDSLLQKYNYLVIQKHRTERYVVNKPAFETLSIGIERLSADFALIESLKTSYRVYELAVQEKAVLENLLKHRKVIKTMTPSCERLTSLLNIITEFTKAHTAYVTTTVTKANIEREIASLQQTLLELDNQVNAYLSEFDVCPTCNTILSKGEEHGSHS